MAEAKHTIMSACDLDKMPKAHDWSWVQDRPQLTKVIMQKDPKCRD